MILKRDTEKKSYNNNDTLVQGIFLPARETSVTATMTDCRCVNL